MARNERVNVRAMLANPDLRRKLMVRTIQATQAREGIETTAEQAERAYHVVTEGGRAAFFSLAGFHGKKGHAEEKQKVFVHHLRGDQEHRRFDVARHDFCTIDGAPLAYRRIGLIAHVFRDNPPLDPAIARARVGAQTGNDPQYVRYWWETTRRDRDATGFTWEPFAKGGDYCRFYADVDLVVHWDPARRTFARFFGRKGREIERPPSLSDFFRPGLTWPLAGGHFSLRWMPPGCVFSHKGPAIFPSDTDMTAPLAGVLNSAVAEYIVKGLISRQSMGARWEVGVVKRLPVPSMTVAQREVIGGHAQAIHNSKAEWDLGNETSTQFERTWLLRSQAGQGRLTARLRRLAESEAREESRIQQLYATLDDEVYKLYGIPESTRAIIEETLGERPPEILWPQMERRTVEQKRMEHVWRLLSYVVKRVVEADEDGVVPFAPLSDETSLLDRVQQELAALFPEQDVNLVEVEIANELKRKVKGYKPAASIGEWLENVYFEYHATLYKKRPIVWHLASNQGRASFAFGVLCHYHGFDANLMAKLRSSYLRDAIETFRREAALADREGRAEDRIELQARLEEAQAFDRKLQAVQEGHHDGPEGGDHDYRILTPWKSAKERPKGWNPDIGDGVKVNIAPLQKAGVLRSAKVA